jgi:hypothetical protein
VFEYFSVSYGTIQALFKKPVAVGSAAVTIDVRGLYFLVVYLGKGFGDGNAPIIIIALSRLIDNAFTANLKTVSIRYSHKNLTRMSRMPATTPAFSFMAVAQLMVQYIRTGINIFYWFVYP